MRVSNLPDQINKIIRNNEVIEMQYSNIVVLNCVFKQLEYGCGSTKSFNYRIKLPLELLSYLHSK